MVDIKEIVEAVKYSNQVDAREAIKTLFVNDIYSFRYNGKVQVKERPRLSKGRTFTPPKTRKFEADVRTWGKEVWGKAPLVYPIRVDLIIGEETTDEDLELHSILGLVYNQKGDIDNLGKSILDALNGVIYKDDKQIMSLNQERIYSKEAGFRLVISRAGLTPLEYRNFKARMK